MFYQEDNQNAYVVVGVEDSSDVLSQIAVQDGLDVITMVDWGGGGEQI